MIMGGDGQGLLDYVKQKQRKPNVFLRLTKTVRWTFSGEMPDKMTVMAFAT